jgi:hypothetical protein
MNFSETAIRNRITNLLRTLLVVVATIVASNFSLDQTACAWAQDDAETAAAAKIEAAGGTVRKIAMSVESKEVAYHLSDKEVTDEALAPLGDIQELVWLYLQGTAITDDGLKHLAGLNDLTKLHLEKTNIGDAGLSHLSGLQKLEYLNLYGTKVTDAGIEHLAKLKGLKRVYLWQTAVTDEGVAKLAAALPEAQIVREVKLAEPQPEPAASADEPAKESLANGRFVRVRLTGDQRILSLAEVIVQQTGDNAALTSGAKASQSSVDFGGEAQRAIDGNTSQNFNDGSVTHTAAEKDPWWQVDLGGAKEIGRIKVLNRGDCCGDRLADAVVEVLDDAQKVVWSDTVKDAKDSSSHVFAK